MSEGEKEARTHMVEIWEGEEIWGDFYAKLLYEGKREGSREGSKPRPSKESIARGSAALPPLPSLD